MRFLETVITRYLRVSLLQISSSIMPLDPRVANDLPGDESDFDISCIYSADIQPRGAEACRFWYAGFSGEAFCFPPWLDDVRVDRLGRRDKIRHAMQVSPRNAARTSH